MLSLGLALLIASVIEALVVLPPSGNLFPAVAQESAGDNLPLETLASALLKNASFASTTASLPLANSSLISNHRVSESIEIYCSEILGRNLNMTSCLSALSTIDSTDTRQLSWGRHGTGVKYDYPIPRQWVSSDGNCILGASLNTFNNGSEVASAVASLQDVALATGVVMAKCVKQRNPNPSQGGVAKNFGGDNKLNVYVAKLDFPSSDVHCYGSVGVRGFVNSCQSILDRMDTEYPDRVFGKRGDVGVEIELPYIWHSIDQKCTMVLETSGPPDTSTWSNVWQAATKVTGMCPTQGKNGAYFHLGDHGKLYLQVAAQNSTLAGTLE